jgi:5'-nucleotidase
MIRRLGVALVPAVLLLAALSATRAQESGSKKFTILYTTDIHAHYLGKDDGKGHMKGGLAAIAAKVKEIRAGSKDPVFLFDSGDVLTGTPVSDVESQGVQGGALFEMMNLVGYDAWCVGNHDFDHGRENVSKIVNMLHFPTFSANLTVEGEPSIKFERWKVIEKGGVKLGVFGLMTEQFARVTGEDKVRGIKVTSTVDAAREAVAALASHCDAIVALSHCGSDDDVKLCDQVQGIDLILSGHNHRPLRPDLHGNDTIVAETAVWAEKLARLDLEGPKGKLHFEGSWVPLDPVEPTGELKRVFDAVNATVGERVKEVLGKVETHLTRSNNAESNSGNFFTDGLKSWTKSDCAFLNSGGIRADHKKPEITVGDVLEIFPFENVVVTFEVTGEDLKKICAKNANACLGNEKYGILQTAGVRYEYTSENGKPVVANVTVNGEPVDPARKYRCASIDFIAIDQHAKYFGEDVKVENVEKPGVLLSKVEEDWVREQGKKGPIKAEIDGRQKRK